MSANKFVLKHHKLEIQYTIGITPGLPALIFRDGDSEPKAFTADRIKTEDTAIGSLTSILLKNTGDAGGERFGFFLPLLDVARGDNKEFTTVGIYEVFGGPDSVPRRPTEWKAVELHGTAESVIVPLSQGAAS